MTFDPNKDKSKQQPQTPGQQTPRKDDANKQQWDKSKGGNMGGKKDDLNRGGSTGGQGGRGI